VFVSSSSVKTPSDDTIVWRYLRLERFLTLIDSKKLRLSRLDSLRDPWEGRWPKAIAEHWGKGPFDGKRMIFDPEQYRQVLFANCWHASQYESAALWYIYSGRAGIAIKSTVGNLKAALIDNSRPAFYIGAVQYKNFETDTVECGSLVGPFLKRKSFEYEHEVRIVIFERLSDPNENAYYLNCNTAVLLKAVYLSPECDDSMKPSVESLLRRYDLGHIPAHRSALYDTSIY
jgi:hypothetical protein